VKRISSFKGIQIHFISPKECLRRSPELCGKPRSLLSFLKQGGKRTLTEMASDCASRTVRKWGKLRKWPAVGRPMIVPDSHCRLIPRVSRRKPLIFAATPAFSLAKIATKNFDVKWFYWCDLMRAYTRGGNFCPRKRSSTRHRESASRICEKKGNIWVGKRRTAPRNSAPAKKKIGLQRRVGKFGGQQPCGSGRKVLRRGRKTASVQGFGMGIGPFRFLGKGVKETVSKAQPILIPGAWPGLAWGGYLMLALAIVLGFLYCGLPIDCSRRLNT